MRLELSKHISEMVTSALVKCLELLEDKRSLCLPFATGAIDVVCSIGILVGPRALVFQLVGLFLCALELLGNGREIPLYRCHTCHFSAFTLILTKWCLDICLDLCGKRFVGLRETFGAGNNALPWHLEDAANGE
jgi:hypothetical protein